MPGRSLWIYIITFFSFLDWTSIGSVSWGGAGRLGGVCFVALVPYQDNLSKTFFLCSHQGSGLFVLNHPRSYHLLPYSTKHVDQSQGSLLEASLM